jgi:Leucine-rich repeat (LRR) protein
MEGLTSLTKLRKLDLSFNKIGKMEGIMALHLLEHLELGKNLLTDVDCL